MKNKFVLMAIGALMMIALSGISFAQGRGRGNGGNSGNVGRGNNGGNTNDSAGGGSNSRQNKGNRGQNDNVRGKDDKDNDGGRGKKDNDHGRGKGADKDNDHRQNDNDNSNRFKGLSKQTGMSEQDLQNRFASEKTLNPNLTYGQFVASNMIGNKNKGVTASELLNGLRNGESIGQTLHNKGWDDNKINKERSRIKKDRQKDSDYDDDNGSWH